MSALHEDRTVNSNKYLALAVIVFCILCRSLRADDRESSLRIFLQNAEKISKTAEPTDSPSQVGLCWQIAELNVRLGAVDHARELIRNLEPVDGHFGEGISEFWAALARENQTAALSSEKQKYRDHLKVKGFPAESINRFLAREEERLLLHTSGPRTAIEFLRNNSMEPIPGCILLPLDPAAVKPVGIDDLEIDALITFVEELDGIETQLATVLEIAAKATAPVRDRLIARFALGLALRENYELANAACRNVVDDAIRSKISARLDALRSGTDSFAAIQLAASKKDYERATDLITVLSLKLDQTRQSASALGDWPGAEEWNEQKIRLARLRSKIGDVAGGLSEIEAVGLGGRGKADVIGSAQASISADEIEKLIVQENSELDRGWMWVALARRSLALKPIRAWSECNLRRAYWSAMSK